MTEPLGYKSHQEYSMRGIKSKNIERDSELQLTHSGNNLVQQL